MKPHRDCPVTLLQCTGERCIETGCWRAWEEDRILYANAWFNGWKPIVFKPLDAAPNWGDA